MVFEGIADLFPYLHNVFLGNVLIRILCVRYSGVRGGDSGNSRSCCVNSGLIKTATHG